MNMATSLSIFKNKKEPDGASTIATGMISSG
jgi:hypothetical protein